MKRMMQISIPEPCNQPWDEMTPSGCGRFCGSCQKVVVDFTTMTDAQILDVFKRAGDAPPCGQFLETQLNRILVAPPPQSVWRRLAGRAAALVLLLQSATVAVAQQKKLVRYTGLPAKVHQPVAAKKALREICGIVKDGKTGQGIAGATVYIQGTALHASSMGGGIFRIALPDSFYMEQIPLFAKPAENDARQQVENVYLPWADMLKGKDIALTLYTVDMLPQHTIKTQVVRVYGGIPVRYEPTAAEPRPKKPWSRIKRLFIRKTATE